MLSFSRHAGLSQIKTFQSKQIAPSTPSGGLAAEVNNVGGQMASFTGNVAGGALGAMLPVMELTAVASLAKGAAKTFSTTPDNSPKRSLNFTPS